MKRAKDKRETKISKRSPSAKKVARNPVDLAEIRQQITNLVGSDAVSMVESTIEEVSNGHRLGMKYLFELIGLYPAPPADTAPMQDSLAATLLRRLVFRNRPCRNRKLPKIAKHPLRFRMMA